MSFYAGILSSFIGWQLCGQAKLSIFLHVSCDDWVYVAGCNIATIVLSEYHILYCIIQNCQAVENVCGPQEAVVKKDVKSNEKWL